MKNTTLTLEFVLMFTDPFKHCNDLVYLQILKNIYFEFEFYKKVIIIKPSTMGLKEILSGFDFEKKNQLTMPKVSEIFLKII